MYTTLNSWEQGEGNGKEHKVKKIKKRKKTNSYKFENTTASLYNLNKPKKLKLFIFEINQLFLRLKNHSV